MAIDRWTDHSMHAQLAGHTWIGVNCQGSIGNVDRDRWPELAMDLRCRFLAIVDVRTIYRYHAKIALLAGHASPVMIKWCLNEQPVELLCKLAMPRLSSGV